MLDSAQSVQFAWFFASTPEVAADEIMKKLLGFEADRVQTNRVPNPQTPFLSSATRVSDGNEYTLNISPGRADLFVQKSVGPNEVPMGLPMIDAWAVSRSVLERFQQSGIDLFGQVYRVAIVIPLLKIFPSWADSQREFTERLGLKEFEGEVRDLIFSFNKRKNSSVVPVQLNRIVKYGVVEFQNVQIDVHGAQQQQNHRVNRIYAFDANLDFNTVPSTTPLPSSKLTLLFSELLEEMIEQSAQRELS